LLTRVLQRRGNSLQWSESNPILAPGEIGLEVDTQTFKIGDGITDWENLPYASGPVGDSAYEIALSEGFSGTEEEWLNSLIGPQGPKGDTGLQGETGEGIRILGTLNDESELPISGEIGDGYVIDGDFYVWNGSIWENVGPIVGPTGANVEISTNPPSGEITAGTLWYDSQTGKSYIYFNDGDSFQWVEL